MNYPDVLLPNPNLKVIKWHDDLLDCSLIRNVSDKDFYDFENKELKIEVIATQSDHLRDYSTNLLGQFQEKHCVIDLIGDNKAFYLDLWKESEKISSPVYEVDFACNEKYCFYLNISDFHNMPIKYTFAASQEMEGKCIVVHTPTNSNFWHFSLRWINSLGDDMTDKKVKIHSKALLSAVKNFIKVNGKPKQEKFGVLSEYHYSIAAI